MDTLRLLPGKLQPVFFSLAGLLLFGCQSVPKQAAGGRSSFEVLEPDKAPTPTPSKQRKKAEAQEEMVSYIASQRRGVWATPPYPKVPAAQAGARSVFVRVYFDETGAVSNVMQSWRGLGKMDEFSEVFRSAVDETVKTWKVEPARNVYYLVTKGGERQYLRTEPLSEYIDVKFSFEENGQVR